MMLAQANRLDNGEIVEGSLITGVDGATYIVDESSSYDLIVDNSIDFDDYEIDPKTLKYSFDGESFYSESEIQKMINHYHYTINEYKTLRGEKQ